MAVTAFDQKFGGQLGGLHIVRPHHVHPIETAGARHADQRHALLGRLFLQPSRRADAARQHDAVDTLRQQRVKRPLQALAVAPALRQKQQLVVRLQRFAQPGGHFGIEGFANVAQNKANHSGFAAAQRRRLAITHITQLLYRLIDLLGGGRRNAPFAAQHQGNRGDRHARLLRHIGDGDFFDAHSLCEPVPGQPAP